MVEIGNRPQGAEWTADQKHVLTYLKETRPKLAAQLPNKYGEWATSKEIAVAIGLKPSGTQEKIRKTVFLLNVGHKQPIISSSKGFKYASNQQEVLKYATEMRRRAEADLYRAEKLAAIAEEMP